MCVCVRVCVCVCVCIRGNCYTDQFDGVNSLRLHLLMLFVLSVFLGFVT